MDTNQQGGGKEQRLAMKMVPNISTMRHIMHDYYIAENMTRPSEKTEINSSWNSSYKANPARKLIHASKATIM